MEVNSLNERQGTKGNQSLDRWLRIYFNLQEAKQGKSWPLFLTNCHINRYEYAAKIRSILCPAAAVAWVPKYARVKSCFAEDRANFRERSANDGSCCRSITTQNPLKED
jgi:hypothetical protein